MSGALAVVLAACVSAHGQGSFGGSEGAEVATLLSSERDAAGREIQADRATASWNRTMRTKSIPAPSLPLNGSVSIKPDRSAKTQPYGAALPSGGAAFRTAGGALPQAPPASEPALTLTLRVGGMVVFGDGAPPGTAPFAELATETRLSGGPRSWLLLTTTQLTAAPGADFEVATPDTWHALDFALSVVVPLKRAWAPSLIIAAGVQARVYEPDALAPPAARRLGLGLRVSSTASSRIAIMAARDERLHGFGALIEASVDVTPAVGFVGSALVARSVSLRLAAVARWGGGNAR